MKELNLEKDEIAIFSKLCVLSDHYWKFQCPLASLKRIPPIHLSSKQNIIDSDDKHPILKFEITTKTPRDNFKKSLCFFASNIAFLLRVHLGPYQRKLIPKI